MAQLDFRMQIVNLTDYINGFALFYTKNNETARDLAQETILKAFLNQDKYKPNTNLKGWLKVIMRNIFINSIRKKGYQNITYDSDSHVVINGTHNLFTPIDEMMEGQIQNEIEKLDSDLRIPFKMHFLGFKYKEIADQLKIPIGTVKSRVFMARKKLVSNIEI